MKKLLGSIAALTLAVGMVFVAPAANATTTTWNTSGTYDIAFTCTSGCSGTYHHKLTLVQDSSGNLMGTGGYPYSGPYSFSWHITSGTVSGSAVSITAVYDTDSSAAGTIMTMNATLNGSGQFTGGTWSDNYGGTTRTGTWTTTGTAQPITTTTTSTITGGGRTGTTGQPQYTFDIDEDGMLTIVNHTMRPPCVYHIDTTDTSHFTFSSNTASFSGTATGNHTNCPNITSVMFTDNASGNDSLKINGGTAMTVRGGSFHVTNTMTSNLRTFSASNSSYYNGPTSSDPLYASGPISFTWDSSTGNVTGGFYTEQVPANTGTLYYNLITGGSYNSSTNAVNLNFYRDNPNNNSFTFTGTLVGNMLTGQLDGPYYFSATGTTM